MREKIEALFQEKLREWDQEIEEVTCLVRVSSGQSPRFILSSPILGGGPPSESSPPGQLWSGRDAGAPCGAPRPALDRASS